MRKKRSGRPNATGRKDGDRYFNLPYPMAHSVAFRSLSGSALKVWVELHTRFNGGNNGKLRLSLDEAARLLGISKTTATRAFAELQEKGFIRMTRRGQWYGRKATEWAITDRSVEGNLPTQDWKNWKPELNKQKKHVLGTVTEHIR